MLRQVLINNPLPEIYCFLRMKFFPLLWPFNNFQFSSSLIFLILLSSWKPRNFVYFNSEAISVIYNFLLSFAFLPSVFQFSLPSHLPCLFINFRKNCIYYVLFFVNLFLFILSRCPLKVTCEYFLYYKKFNKFVINVYQFILVSTGICVQCS